MRAYGTYNPDPLRLIWRCSVPTMTLPVASPDGGLADATYVWESKCDSDGEQAGHHRYRLTGIHEWMPPVHPSLRNRPDRKPSTRPDGTVDLEAEAMQRRREWDHMSALDGESVWEEDDSVNGS